MKSLTLKNYLGYALAEIGNSFGYSIVSTYLIIYFTDVLGSNFTNKTLWATLVTVIMIIVRILDIINDPFIGNYIENHTFRKGGKFKPFILYFGILFSLIIVILFLPITNMPMAVAAIFALLTYIIYGIFQSLVLVPFGSIVSIMTRDSIERSKLSILRSLSASIGAIPAGMLFPLLIYGENKAIKSNALFLCVLVSSLLILVTYIIGYFTINENYKYEKSKNKIKLVTSLKRMIHNKPFLIICFIACLLISLTSFTSSINVYLFNVVFESPKYYSLLTFANYIPMLIYLPLCGVLMKHFDKKSISIVTLLFSIFSSMFLFIFRPNNVWVYISLIFIESFGYSFINLEIYAFILDTIKYQESISNVKEDASCFSIFILSRKIGQILVAFLPLILTSIGYNSSDKIYNENTKNLLYLIATIVPLIILILIFILICIYPLTDKKLKSKNI